MTLRFMLDTNICICAMKSRPPHLQDQLQRYRENVCISAITLAELYFGAEKSQRIEQNLRSIERFSAALQLLPFGALAAAHFGQLRALLKRAGTPISTQDLLTGAHARSEALTLVTNNRREFDRLPGLLVENWI
jgi:tRNA(fMet)-specific endonuclease VapC